MEYQQGKKIEEILNYVEVCLANVQDFDNKGRIANHEYVEERLKLAIDKCRELLFITSPNNLNNPKLTK